MKKILLIAIVALSLGSCKKKETPAPVQPCTELPVNNNIGIHIWIESQGSTSTGVLTGTLEFNDDTDLGNQISLFKRDFNQPNGTKYTYDTTFVLTAAHIRAITYLVAQTPADIDIATDTQIKIWFDGELKYWGAGSTIFNQTVLK